eukprot:1159766-Pelagomonas_calceolata.AAC.12
MSKTVPSGGYLQVQTHGMAASIIDFTASRLRTLTGALAYCDLSCDPELFEGTKGVIQVSEGDKSELLSKMCC